MSAQQVSTIHCLSEDNSEERMDQKHHTLEMSERIDNRWLQRYYQSLPSPPFGMKRSVADYRDAYLFGLRSRTQNKAPYFESYDILKETWIDLIGPSVLEWEEAEPIIQYAYTRVEIKNPGRVRMARQDVA